MKKKKNINYQVIKHPQNRLENRKVLEIRYKLSQQESLRIFNIYFFNIFK